MFVIKQATTADIPLINKLAWNVFPETYKNILSHEQIEYMMDWMYSIENLHKQMEEEGHIYYIAYEECEAAGYVSIRQEDTDLFHLEKIYVIPYYQKYHLGKQLFQQAIKGIKKISLFFNSKLIVKLKGCNDDNIVISKEKTVQFKKWLDR
jgi:ribosomal protein S18 acetylase RimI-like enzyme